MDLKFRKVLENIDFLNKYGKLSKKYDNVRTPDRDRLLRPDGIEVCDIFEDMGYDLKFSKGVDKFAYFDEQHGDYDFSFRFNLSYGTVETIFVISEKDKMLVRTHLGFLSKCLGLETPIRKPIFSNYDDLKEIFKTLVGIYLDCKEELIRLAGVEFKEPEKVYKIGIPELPILEQIIPIPYHEMANEFTKDFNAMDNAEFCKKYDACCNLWIRPEDFMVAREHPDTFGKALVRFLANKRCLIRFSSTVKLPPNEIRNHWGEEVEVQPVYLYIADGTRYCTEKHYYTFIPKSVDLDSILGIEIGRPKYDE